MSAPLPIVRSVCELCDRTLRICVIFKFIFEPGGKHLPSHCRLRAAEREDVPKVPHWHFIMGDHDPVTVIERVEYLDRPHPATNLLGWIRCR